MECCCCDEDVHDIRGLPWCFLGVGAGVGVRHFGGWRRGGRETPGEDEEAEKEEPGEEEGEDVVQAGDLVEGDEHAHVPGLGDGWGGVVGVVVGVGIEGVVGEG